MKELYLLCQHETGRELAIRFNEGRLPSVPDRYHAYAVLTEAPQYDRYGNSILPATGVRKSGEWREAINGNGISADLITTGAIEEVAKKLVERATKKRRGV